ncbi:hypothetical protein KJ742_04625 [Patescibacteria group bacterium]|nr:hypothetical protein [Patescibacteria group bacterium]MBU1683203.1 hypothetical protein [Patescibacteria group bacterium]
MESINHTQKALVALEAFAYQCLKKSIMYKDMPLPNSFMSDKNTYGQLFEYLADECLMEYVNLKKYAVLSHEKISDIFMVLLQLTTFTCKNISAEEWYAAGLADELVKKKMSLYLHGKTKT